MTASNAPADPPSSDRGDGDASEKSESTNDEVTRPRLVIRRVATATRGKGRVKPRKAQMETCGDVKTLADLPRVDGTRAAPSHHPATFHLPYVPAPSSRRRGTAPRRADPARPHHTQTRPFASPRKRAVGLSPPRARNQKRRTRTSAWMTRPPRTRTTSPRTSQTRTESRAFRCLTAPTRARATPRAPPCAAASPLCCGTRAF